MFGLVAGHILKSMQLAVVGRWREGGLRHESRRGCGCNAFRPGVDFKRGCDLEGAREGECVLMVVGACMYGTMSRIVLV